MSDESEEKTDPASSKKLRDLRARGIIPTAPTASDYVAFSVALGTTIGLAGMMIDRLASSFDTAFNLLINAETNDSTEALRYFLIYLNAPLLGILCAAVAAGVLFKLISQGGFVFAMERVQPNLGAVNPVSGLQNMFKGPAMTNFLASFIRFLVMIIVLVGLGWLWARDLINLDLCSPTCIWPITWVIIRAILTVAAILIIVTIFFDIAIQQYFFMEQQKMSKTEVKQERKDQNGQPEVRSERKRIARELMDGAQAVGRNRATVYFAHGDGAVAFAFHPQKMPLPKVAARARGREAVALLRADLDSRGVTGFPNEEIVEACINLPLGAPAKREVFMTLAGYLRYMYSQ